MNAYAARAGNGIPPAPSDRHDGRVWQRAARVALIGSALPIRNIHYFLPLAVVLVLARGGLRVYLTRYVAFTAGILVAGASGNAAGVLWAPLTYSPLILLLIRLRPVLTPPDSERLIRRVTSDVTTFVLIQGAVGLAQYVMYGNPDYVAGTYDLLTVVGAAPSIGQVMFGASMLGLILFLSARPTTRRTVAAIVVGTAAVLVSQSGHALILCGVGLLVAYVITRFSPARILKVAAVTGVAALAFSWIYPSTSRVATSWWERSTSPESPKRLVWSDADELLLAPQRLLTGVGPGQFSSRAGLISSGDYFSVRLPAMLTGRSEVYVERVQPLLDDFDRRGEGSAISKPYSSLSSVVFEFGVVISALAVARLVVAFGGSVVRARRARGEQLRLRTHLLAGCVFVALLALVENYLEFPQALVAPIVVGAVAWGRLTALGTTGHDSRPAPAMSPARGPTFSRNFQLSENRP